MTTLTDYPDGPPPTHSIVPAPPTPPDLTRVTRDQPTYELRQEALPDHVREVVLRQLAGSAARDAASLIDLWLQRRSPDTLATYRSALRQFATWFGDGTPLTEGEAVQGLFALPGPAALGVVQRWVAALDAAGSPPATVHLRYRALQSLVELAHRLEHIDWELDKVTLPALEKYRDTAGPTRQILDELWRQIRASAEPARSRDTALVCLMYGHALRRKEVSGLNLSDVEPDRQAIQVLRKRRRQQERIVLRPRAWAGLEAWLSARGDAPGPLFLSLSPVVAQRPLEERRLTGNGIYKVLRTCAARVAAALDRDGVVIRPHGLRHSGITEFAQRVSGDVRLVREFSGHSSVQTVMHYIDRWDAVPDETGDLMAAMWDTPAIGTPTAPGSD